MLPEEEDVVEDDTAGDAGSPASRPPEESGLDSGSGDPNDDRAFLMNQPPAQAAPDDSEEG